jgi:hypothetical protein
MRPRRGVPPDERPTKAARVDHSSGVLRSRGEGLRTQVAIEFDTTVPAPERQSLSRRAREPVFRQGSVPTEGRRRAPGALSAHKERAAACAGAEARRGWSRRSGPRCLAGGLAGPEKGELLTRGGGNSRYPGGVREYRVVGTRAA